MKNRIRRAAQILGGKFVTHDYLHGRNGWIDACFLGRRAPVFYNLTIETACHAFREAVLERAWQRSYELAPERELLFSDAVNGFIDRFLATEANYRDPRPRS